MRWTLFFLFFLLAVSNSAISQDVDRLNPSAPDPKIAFLKSLAVPGWGHYYVDRTDWRRGQYHLAAEVALVLSYVGLAIQSNHLQHNWYTYARMEAGVDIEDRDRGFQLAVGNFENLQAYNDYQERNRNWNKLYEDVPVNSWSWRTRDARDKYENLRSRFETIDQQLPALLSLMVVNRVISAISAYNRARKKRKAISNTAVLNVLPYRGAQGVVAHLKFNF